MLNDLLIEKIKLKILLIKHKVEYVPTRTDCVM